MRNRTNIYELMEKVNQYDEGRKSAYASGEDDGGEKNIINQSATKKFMISIFLLLKVL